MYNIFLSYCWDDKKELSNALKYIKKKIENNANYKVFYDIDESLKGGNLDKYENYIEKSDLILVFCSKNYVQATLNKDRELFKEFKHIKSKAIKNEYSVVPILIDKKLSSKPKGIERLFHFSMNVENLKLNINNEEIKSIIDTIFRRTKEGYPTKEKIDEAKDLLKIKYANKKLPEHCHVQLGVLNSIIEQQTYFVIGRKGSGKSTLVESLQSYCKKNSTKYKKFYIIRAEEFNLEEIYCFLRGINDFSSVLVFEVFWETFIKLYSILMFCLELQNSGIEDNNKKIVIQEATEKIKEHFSNNDLFKIFNKLPVFIAEMIDNFTKKDINNHLSKVAIMQYAHNIPANRHGAGIQPVCL